MGGPSFKRTLVRAVAAFVAGILAISCYTSWRLRSEAIEDGLRIAEMHARSMEDFLTQNLRVAELSAGTLFGDGQSTNGAISNDRLRDAVRNSPLIRTIALLDEQDRIVASSNPAAVGKHIPPDSFLPIPAQHQMLSLSVPWQGRDFADGQAVPTGVAVDEHQPYFIPLLRTLNVQGRLQRVAIALNPDYLLNRMVFDLAGSRGSASLMRYDGVVLVDTGEHGVGTQHAAAAISFALDQRNAGRFERTRAGHQPVLGAFRSSTTYPALVVVALDREALLAGWLHETLVLAAVILPTVLLACAAAAVFLERRRRYEKEIEAATRQQRIHASVFTHAREAILITAANGTIIDVNDAFTRITGYSAAEAIGNNPRMLSSGRHDHNFYGALWATLLAEGHWHGEVWNRRKDGTIYAEMLTIDAVTSHGTVSHYVALFSDITSNKAHEQELEHIAHYDALTGLPNRLLLADRLQQAMSHARRTGARLAAVFIDLDGFKAVNDNYGHDAGDVLLVELSRRMKHSLREGDTLARLGGDEFVAVLIDLVDSGAAVPLLRRLLQVIAQPVPYGDAQLRVTGSLGISFYPQSEDVDGETLLQQADEAMYQAKVGGKNAYRMYDATLANASSQPQQSIGLEHGERLWEMQA